MRNTTTLIIEHENDLSPKEFAEKVAAVLEASDIKALRVSHTDIDTIVWTYAQENREQIVRGGPGYGAPRHLLILERAGY